MRVIVAGCRTLVGRNGYIIVKKAIEASGYKITRLLTGCASGADYQGGQWAILRAIPVEPYKADWKRYGRKAGPLRNAEMVRTADALIAVWDGESRGTKDVIERAMKAGLDVFVYNYALGTTARIAGCIERVG